MEEIWRAHPVHSRYLVSSNGNIKGPFKLRKPKIGLNGYHRISLFFDGRHVYRSVHRLVVETFIGSIPKDKCINHIDGDKGNNDVSNLEIVTYSENRLHSCRVLGRGLGSTQGKAKINESDVLVIRSLIKEGISDCEIARRYRMSSAAIRFLRIGKTWRHVPCGA